MVKELNDETTRDNAAGPAEVPGDSGLMRQHWPRDQMEVDRYLNSKQASRASGLDVRTSKLVPLGANDDCTGD